MSVSDFEEQVFKYVWRGFVLAGLVTLLWGFFAPVPNTQTQGQAQGVTSTASNQTSNSAASVAASVNEAR
jgi:hypothetical protein